MLGEGEPWGAFRLEDGALKVNAQVIARQATTGADRFAVPRGTELKIAYSATGDGLVTLRGHGPPGQTIDALWNSRVHAASTAIPDSDDFHSGWNFPTTGCWNVTIQRGEDLVALPVFVAEP